MSKANPRFHRNNPHLPAIGVGNGSVQYRILGFQENQVTVCTFNYAAPVPAPTPGQLAVLLSSISTTILSPFLACVSSDWTVDFEELIVTHRNDLNGPFSVAHTGTGGSRGTPTLSTEMAVVVLRESAIKGQHGRGRVSLPGVCAADCTRSKVTAAALITNLATLATAMKATCSDGVNTWTPSITERSLVSPRLVVGFSAITAVVADALLGTVRRRKIGRGK